MELKSQGSFLPGKDSTLSKVSEEKLSHPTVAAEL
jgi:hypothetical protein